MSNIFDEAGFMLDNVNTNKEEIDKWHEEQMKKIQKEHERRMAKMDNLFSQLDKLIASGDNEAIKNLLNEAKDEI